MPDTLIASLPKMVMINARKSVYNKARERTAYAVCRTSLLSQIFFLFLLPYQRLYILN